MSVLGMPGERFGVFEKTFAVHGDSVGIGQETKGAGVRGALADFAVADQFEGALEVAEAEEHLFTATAGGDEADAGFDETHVGFGGGLDAAGGESDFAATAEGHAEGRGDDRAGRVLERHGGLLETADSAIELVPFAILCGEEDHHQVGADGEVFAVVGDDQGLEVAAEFIERGVDHLHGVFTEGVHLTVEFEAERAIAEIDQRCAGVAVDHAADALEVANEGDARARLAIAVAAVGEIVVACAGEAVAIGGLVEAARAIGHHAFDGGGDLAAIAAHAGDGFADAERVPELEGAFGEGEAPAHGAVDFDDAV
jgi:hypothetical protein